MNVFSGYARYYDLIYKNKDYGAECDKIEKIFDRYSNAQVQSILELGCGTGGHGLHLSKRGYRVTGVDISNQMLGIAKYKKEAQAADNLTLIQGDIRDLDLGKTFDAVISMFAVISYQGANEDLMRVFRSVNKHLKTGFPFVFDCWYGPAVLNIKPVDRIARFDDGEGIKVIRYAKPSMEYSSNIVKVQYHLIALKDGSLLDDFTETHRMRYFFIPELEFMLKQAGLLPIGFYDFNDISRSPSEDTWNIICIAIKG